MTQQSIGFDTLFAMSMRTRLVQSKSLVTSSFVENGQITNLNLLSKRETECLQLIIRGKSARQLGIIMGISQRTVEEYLNNIKLKFGVSTKAEIIELVVNNMSHLNKLYLNILMYTQPI